LGRLRFKHRLDEGPAQIATVESRYDGFFKTTTIDELNHHSYVVSDGAGALLEKGEVTAEGTGGTLKTRYIQRPFGLLGKTLVGTRDDLSVTDAGFNQTLIEQRADVLVTEMDYDHLGRRTDIVSPDTGRLRTFFNAFGELREERDAAGRVTTFDHDGLGRVTARIDQTSGGSARTDYTFDVGANGLGELGAAVSPDGVRTSFAYDRDYAGVSTTDWTMPGAPAPFNIAKTYDDRGRIESITYPAAAGSAAARFAVRYVYDSAFVGVRAVENQNNGKQYWRADARDPLGRIRAESFGDAFTRSSRDYYAETGRLRSITTIEGLDVAHQLLSYQYDPDGSLVRRRDDVAGFYEGFSYDELGRVKHWYQSASNPEEDTPTWASAWRVSYGYDDKGNLTLRSSQAQGVQAQTTTYDYLRRNNGGPHAVTRSSLWSGEFEYDPVGNVTRHPGLGLLEYTPFSLPRVIRSPGQPANAFQAHFQYDAFGSRAIKRTGGPDGNAIFYVGGLYEFRQESATAGAHVFYIAGGDRIVAQVVRPSAAAAPESVKYIHGDHLGSTNVVQNEDGGTGAPERPVYDPFGNSITVSGETFDPRLSGGAPGPFVSSAVTTGFAGHEHDGELGLINMQGRIYDPRLGRFLEADPFVQAPTFSQSFNRYSYAFNNPLTFTDPTGYFNCQGNVCTGVSESERTGGRFDNASCTEDANHSFTCTLNDDLPEGEDQFDINNYDFEKGYWRGTAREYLAEWNDENVFDLARKNLKDPLEYRYTYTGTNGKTFYALGDHETMMSLAAHYSGDLAAAEAVLAAVTANVRTYSSSVAQNNVYTCIGAGECSGPGVQIASETRARLEAESQVPAGARIDPATGKPILVAEVTGHFNRKTGVLTMTDVDTGQTVKTKARSGGRPYGDPLPAGRYEILERGKKDNYYRLDPIDSKPRNDKHEPTGRDLFRLHHLGRGMTIGCISCTIDEDWRKMDRMLKDTKSTFVLDLSLPWYKMFKKEYVLRFGVLTVE
jgi:RHS repeat-associated protein